MVSQNRVEERLAGLVKEEEGSEAKAEFKERLGKANEVLDVVASQVLEGGGGTIARVGNGLGKEYKGIPRETNVLMLSGQSDTLVSTHYFRSCWGVHTNRDAGLIGTTATYEIPSPSVRSPTTYETDAWPSSVINVWRED